MAIRKILVATDFSQSAETALATAVTLARPLGASLHLFHAIPLPMQPMPPAEAVMMPAAYWEQTRRDVNSRLDRIKAEVAAKGLTCTAESLEDMPGFGISRAAKRTGSDLIVMGSRGLTGLKHVVLGSVAERTARTAECPVLTVKHDSGQSFALRKILVPMDFSPAALAALDLVKSLRKALGPLHLILVHAYFIPVELEQYLAKDGDDLRARITRGVTRELEDLLAGLEKEDISSEYVASQGHPDQVITAVARDKHVDLIAMGTHGRRGLPHLLLGSTAERVVRSADGPVLTVRGPAAKK